MEDIEGLRKLNIDVGNTDTITKITGELRSLEYELAQVKEGTDRHVRTSRRIHIFDEALEKYMKENLLEQVVDKSSAVLKEVLDKLEKIIGYIHKEVTDYKRESECTKEKKELCMKFIQELRDNPNKKTNPAAYRAVITKVAKWLYICLPDNDWKKIIEDLDDDVKKDIIECYAQCSTVAKYIYKRKHMLELRQDC